MEWKNLGDMVGEFRKSTHFRIFMDFGRKLPDLYKFKFFDGIKLVHGFEFFNSIELFYCIEFLYGIELINSFKFLCEYLLLFKYQ